MQFSSLYGARLDEELGTDDNSVLFTTARRKYAINKGQSEFAELTECFQGSVHLPIISGNVEYDLNLAGGNLFVRFAKRPPEFSLTDTGGFITFLTGDDFQFRDPSWLNRYFKGWQGLTLASSAASVQLPQFYYDRHDAGQHLFGMVPKPYVTVGSSASVLIFYVARPLTLTADTDEPYFVSPNNRTDLRDYHQALVHYGAHQLEKLRRDDQASDRQLQKFIGYVQRYLQNTRTKGGTALTMARNYFKTRTAVQDPRT